MPQPFDASNPGIPLLWTDDELCCLEGTYLGSELPKKRSEVRLRWQRAVGLLQSCDWDIAPYTWSIVFSPYQW